MAYQELGIGTVVNDGTGDTLPVAGDKINDNFLEIYTLIGDGTSLTSGISATATVVTLTAPTITGVVGGTQTSATITTLTGTTFNAGTLALAAGSITDSSGAISFGNENLTTTGSVTAASLDISGNVDIDGTLETDALTIDGVSLAETISDTVGAMVSSNTETNITVTYDDADNTLDFVIGTLNQSTSGNAATATALETARTIGGTSFDGTANIAVALSATATALANARTIHGVSFDGTANIDLSEVVQDTVGAMFSSNTETNITATYQDSDGTIDLVIGTLNQDTTGTAAIATTVTITDNESTNESNALIFTAGGDVNGGNLGLESDGTLTYNPSTGKVTATGFVGTLTGNVTGNTSGTAATVTGAAQTNITSVGTLTALQVDNININGNAITSTAGTDLTITPVAGQQIVLDGTIVIDAGVVTGATSITSTAFVGDITGDVTGTADVATVATTVTITDNESTNESNALIFTAGGDVDGGNLGLESDGTLTYNPSTGKVTATGFVGTLTGAVTGDITGDVTGNADTATTLATARTIGGTSFDGSANIAVALATLATTATVSDSTANTNFPVVFNNESNALLDDTGALRYNPSTGTLLVPNLVVAGTTTTVDTVTMEAANAIIFEGATADDHETTLTIIDPTADRTINLPNQSGTVPVLAAASNTAITSTPAELNKLDGATVVVGEINALDLGSTAVGTAIASKAVVLDSSKDYTGIRNLTISGEIDAATGDYSGAVDVAGATTVVALTASGLVTAGAKIDMNGTELILDADADTSITADTDDQIDIRIAGADDFTFTANTFTAVSGSTIAAQALTATTITASGIIKTDDSTAATSTTDGSLQTDGGLSVVLDAVIGDDIIMLSDAAVIHFGADSDVTLTHVADTGLLLNGTSVIQFNDASQSIGAPSNAILDINATDEIELNATLLDVNANINASGTYTGAGTMTTGGNIVIPNAGNIGSAGDTDSIAIASNGVVTFSQIPVMPANSIDSDEYIDGSIDREHLAADIIDGTKIADDAIDSEHYADGSIDTAHIADNQITLAKMAGIARGKIIYGDASGDPAVLAPGTNAQVLSTDGTDLTWTDISVSSLAADNLSAGDAAILLTTSSGNITIDAAANDSDIILKGTDGGADTTFLTIDGSAAGEATFNAGIVIADAGTIGSASDKDAIAIGSDGDVTLTQDLELQHDGAILSFGADDDVTLTHVADAGVMFNAAMQLRFRDSAISIGSPADGDLDINADDEIELNSTLIDVNGNLDVSGTGVIAGAVTTAALTASGIIKTDDTTAATSTTDGSLQTDGGLSVALDAVIGDDLIMLSDAAVIHFGADKDVTLTHVADTGLLLNAAMVVQFRDSAINIGSPADGDLDINADDEIELNSTLIDVNGNLDVSGTIVGASTLSATTGTFSGILKTDDATEATSTTDGSLQTDGGLSVVKDIVAGDDIKLLSDAAVVAFGTNSEITLTHVHDVGLTLTHVTAGDNLPVVLQLKSEEDIVVANEVIASIEFAAGDSDGTDGATVAAGIHAIAEDTFSASANATKLVFTTGVSETAASSATAKATLSSIGDFEVAGDLVIKDTGLIGSTSDKDAMSISSGGVVNFSARPTFAASLTIQDGGSLGSASDINAITISDGGVVAVTATTASTSATSGALTVGGGAGIAADLSVGDDLFMISDAAVLTFGADKDVTVTHVADTGLLLNAAMVVQFRDSAINIGSPADGDLDINADDEIELNSTLIDINGAVDISGATTVGGILKTDDTTAATSTTDGSLQTDGGLSVAADAVIGDDLFMLSDGAVVTFGAGKDVTLTHVHDTGLLLNAAMVMQFRDSAINIGSPADGDLDINADDEIELNSTLIDINGAVDISGATTVGGILKTDDTTAATNTTDGSLQTDGGLSVAADAVIGDDLFMLSDAAVLTFGADKDVTLTHVHNTGILLNSTNVIQFNDASQNIGAPSATVLDINATDEIELNATLVDINANVEISGNLTVAGTTTQVDTVTMNAANAVVFEGATADAHETTLTIVDPTGDRTINLPNVSGTIPVLAAASTTQITSTPAELNILDGATVVVGEINALDIGSTAVGTAVASKAVILDSSKDYTGIRNLTISGEIDAATGDFSGAVDVAGATTTAAITASGIIKTDDTTAATSTTDGSLQTDGGLSVTLDAVIGDDLFMLSDAAVVTFGADKDVTLTHVADTGLLLNAAMVVQFRDSAINIGSPADGDLDINADDEIELNSTLIDVNGNLDVSGTGVIAGAVTTAALTASGIIKTDDTTAATSTTDGSLQTDGGLSVAADAVIGDDLFMLSDAAVVTFGADKDVTLTHVADTGLLLNGTSVIQFNDASQNIGAPSNAILDINATDEIELNATLIDVNGNLDVSGTGVIAGHASIGVSAVHSTRALTVAGATDGSGSSIFVAYNSSLAAKFSIRDDGLVDVNGNLDVSGTIVGADALSATTGTFSGILKTDDATEATSTTDGSLQTDGGLSVVKDIVAGDDIKLLSDAAVIHFGTNSEITATHVHNVGLTLTHTATGDNTPMVLQLKSEEDAIVANEVIASLEFAAGDSDGTDGATVAAGIHAIAEGTFSASANATKLVFTTGVSETAASSATAKMTLASDGDLTVAGTVTADPTAVLLIKNSAGSTLKTINGIAAN